MSILYIHFPYKYLMALIVLFIKHFLGHVYTKFSAITSYFNKNSLPTIDKNFNTTKIKIFVRKTNKIL